MPLRKATEDDRTLLREWRIANEQYFPPGPKLTVDRHLEWWQRYVETPHDHMYMVCTGPPEFQPVGTLAIDIRSKMIGRVMRGSPEGPGLMTGAMYELMTLYGTGTYTLQVIEGNNRAVEFYERLGFRKFGRQYTYRTNIAMINMLKEVHW